MKLLNPTHHRLEFSRLILINLVSKILPNHRFIGRNNYHLKLIYLMKLLSLGEGGASHPGQFVIHSEVVLKGNGGKGHAFPLHLDPLLGFYCLM